MTLEKHILYTQFLL